MNNQEFLEQECFRNAQKLNVNLSDEEYANRLAYEIKIIKDKGFIDYFLIVSDVLNWARNNGILIGPGRGSAAGSLVCYLLKITQIDPIKYDLIFERFMNPSRSDLPDIDVDFQKSRRDEIFEYIRNKYGEQNTCQIITYGHFHFKQAFRDVCRVFKIPIAKVNKLTSLLDKDDKSWEDGIKYPEIRDFMVANPKIARATQKLIGSIKHRSKHAAGMLIVPGQFTDYVTVERVSNKDGIQYVSTFDMDSLGRLNLLKLDILSVGALDIIQATTDLIGDVTLPIDFDDDKVYDIFKEGMLLGVFQFKSNLLTNISKKLQIDNFTTLYAATTIARPGPLYSGETNHYIKRHQGKDKVEYLHPMMESITSETYGLILYQEQAMQIAVKLANFSLEEAELLRKVIAKSKGLEVINQYRAKFIDGCIANSIPKDVATSIWNIIKQSGSYSFNKSHAVAYSALTYWCAWLKTYYPVEFLVSVARHIKEKDLRDKAIRELRKMGVKVKSPDINYSNVGVSLHEGVVYIGLQDIERVGKEAVKNILENRPYESFDDFISKVQKRKVNSAVVKNLIQAGAFDKFGRRDRMYHSFSDEPFHEWEEKEMLERQNMVVDMIAGKPLIQFYENKYEQNVDITPIENIDFSYNEEEIWCQGIVSDFKERVVKTNNVAESVGVEAPMCFFSLDDGTKKVECVMIAETYHIFNAYIDEGEPIMVKAHTYGNNERLRIDGVLNLSKENNRRPLEKYLYNKRQAEYHKYRAVDHFVSTISRTSYHVSKNNNPYAMLHLSDGKRVMNFRLESDPYEPGEIIVWKESKDGPFATIKERIP
jgi:DNA polymerase-3 subunit alpha